jgi:hypothetical protein
MGRGHQAAKPEWERGGRVVRILGSVVAVLIGVSVAMGQALDLAGSLDLLARVTADREGCETPASCVRLRIAIHNLGARERFVSQRLLDLDHLRITSGGQHLRLIPRSGRRRTAILERLDSQGGSKDHIAEVYMLPGCCMVQTGSTVRERLPAGFYAVTYEAATSPESTQGDGHQSMIPSTPATFTIEAD